MCALRQTFIGASTLGVCMGDMNLTPDQIKEVKQRPIGNVQDVSHHPVTGWCERHKSLAKTNSDYIIAGDANVEAVVPAAPYLHGLDKDHVAVFAKVVYRASTPVPPSQPAGVTDQDMQGAKAVLKLQEARAAAATAALCQKMPPWPN